MVDVRTREPEPPELDQKAQRVKAMFSAIANRYDLLNHLLSLNRDRYWRRRAVDRLLAGSPPTGRFLDSCAGTLDLTVELARRPDFRGEVVASDFTFDMLRRGVAKTADLPVRTACADALCMPFREDTFDGGMVAFGIRNLASIDEGLREFARVLRPGATMVILEFGVPRRQPLRACYLFYFRRLLPAVGHLLSHHDSAYHYLPASVLAFPSPDALAGRIEAAGFRDVAWDDCTGGIVVIHRARKA